MRLLDRLRRERDPITPALALELVPIRQAHPMTYAELQRAIARERVGLRFDAPGRLTESELRLLDGNR